MNQIYVYIYPLLLGGKFIREEKQNFKAAREKSQVTYKTTSIRLLDNFSSETLQF